MSFKGKPRFSSSCDRNAIDDVFFSYEMHQETKNNKVLMVTTAKATTKVRGINQGNNTSTYKLHATVYGQYERAFKLISNLVNTFWLI